MSPPHRSSTRRGFSVGSAPPAGGGLPADEEAILTGLWAACSVSSPRIHRTARRLHLPEEFEHVIEIDLGGGSGVGGEVSEGWAVGYHGVPPVGVGSMVYRSRATPRPASTGCARGASGGCRGEPDRQRSPAGIARRRG